MKNDPLAEVRANEAEMEDILRRLQPEMRRAKPSAEAIAAALESAQRLAAEADAENGAEDTAREIAPDSGARVCGVCGYRNREGTKFCGMCGIAVGAQGEGRPAEHERSQAMVRQPSSPVEALPPSPRGNETHHYHHHYHHHYFPGPEGMYPRAGMDPVREVAREEKLRPNPAMRGDLSRAEAAVRQVTQEWVLACNTKHLDDLVELYVADGIVLRSNCPAIRGASAAREFFFGALDAGLGEVELEPLRVDVVGDLAYEAGRFKALVPSATGKRREERGKYLWVCQRQSNAEWKLAADCWSSDLTLSTLESDVPLNAAVKTNQPRK